MELNYFMKYFSMSRTLLYVIETICLSCIIASSTKANRSNIDMLRLEEAGCDSDGKLIGNGVCVDDDYQVNKAPDQNITNMLSQFLWYDHD